MDISNFQKNNEGSEPDIMSMSEEEFQDYLKTLSNDEALEVFAEDLLIESNCEEQDPNVRAELRTDLIEQINGFANGEILKALPQDKFDEINSFDLNDPDLKTKVSNVIESSGIDLQKISSDALIQFRKNYLGDK